MNFNCCKNKKSTNKLDKVVNFLKVISEENRLKILCILKKEGKCVCEIWQFLDLPQNLISHHLKVLKDFGLINSRKKGAKVFYFLNKKSVRKFISLVSYYVNN